MQNDAVADSCAVLCHLKLLPDALFADLPRPPFAGRLLQISSFNGKMNALNEVNKVIGNMANYSYGRGVGDDDEWLTADKMAVRCSAADGDSCLWDVHQL